MNVLNLHCPENIPVFIQYCHLLYYHGRSEGSKEGLLGSKAAQNDKILDFFEKIIVSFWYFSGKKYSPTLENFARPWKKSAYFNVFFRNVTDLEF